MFEAQKDLVRRWTEEIWNQGSLPAIDEIVAASYVHHDPAQPEFSGRAALKQQVAALHTSFPDIHYSIDDLICEGDKIAVRCSYTGTHRGEWMGMPPTGKRLAGTANVLLRIEAGKVAEIWSVWDALGFMRTMGAIPASIDANKAIARRYVEDLINRGNLSLVEELFAPDSVARLQHVPEFRGLEARRAFLSQLFSAFPDIRFTIEEMTAEGDHVVVLWTQNATHRSEWMGLPATGKKVTWSGVTELRISGGKIVEEIAAWDALSAVQQLGALPALA